MGLILNWLKRRAAKRGLAGRFPELEWSHMNMKEQARVIDEVAMAYDLHPDLVTVADIAMWEVRDESF